MKLPDGEKIRFHVAMGATIRRLREEAGLSRPKLVASITRVA